MNDERSTPQWLYDQLNEIFHFTLDAAATVENAKCERYYTIETDGLAHSWAGETVFCNPPYSRGSLEKWVQKARGEGLNAHAETTIVMILPGDTSTKWFPWDATRLVFLRKRVAFDGISAGAKFPTVIAVFGDYEVKDPLANIGQVIG